MINNEYVKAFAKYVAKCAGLEADKINVLGMGEDLRRVYFTYNNTEYTIRTWNISGDYILDYTLYKTITDETGTHGETIYSGINYNIVEGKAYENI